MLTMIYRLHGAFQFLIKMRLNHDTRRSTARDLISARFVEAGFYSLPKRRQSKYLASTNLAEIKEPTCTAASYPLFFYRTYNMS